MRIESKSCDIHPAIVSLGVFSLATSIAGGIYIVISGANSLPCCEWGHKVALIGAGGMLLTLGALMVQYTYRSCYKRGEETFLLP